MRASNKIEPTVRARVSRQRAGDDFQLLFHCLELFLNLRDNVNEFEAFFRQYGTFFPVEFYDGSQGQATRERVVGWQREFYDVFLLFRNMLRDVWVRGDRQKLGALLGTNGAVWKIINRQGEAGFLDRVIGGYERLLQSAIQNFPKGYFAMASEIKPDWGSGTFHYEADTNFRKAVYRIFRQSWRAKVCPQCERYFIADKPPQRYCSTKCHGMSKRTRDLQFWRSVGSNRRKERAQERKR